MDLETVVASVKAFLRFQSSGLKLSPTRNLLNFIKKVELSTHLNKAVLIELNKSRNYKRVRDLVFSNLSLEIIKHVEITDARNTAIEFWKAFKTLVPLNDILWVSSSKSFSAKVILHMGIIGVHPLKALAVIELPMYQDFLYQIGESDTHPLDEYPEGTAQRVIETEQARGKFSKAKKRERSERLGAALKEAECDRLHNKHAIRNYVNFKSSAELEEVVGKTVLRKCIMVNRAGPPYFFQRYETELERRVFGDGDGCDGRRWIEAAEQLAQSDEFYQKMLLENQDMLLDMSEEDDIYYDEDNEEYHYYGDDWMDENDHDWPDWDLDSDASW
ncbi:hypothetical protein HDU76_011175 [Blyttiomyces sp. JEL0837]|nr:hypothetical protein HDU76_011175 [Blyttiomyces sp. JEL0837]